MVRVRLQAWTLLASATGLGDLSVRQVHRDLVSTLHYIYATSIRVRAIFLLWAVWSVSKPSDRECAKVSAAVKTQTNPDQPLSQQQQLHAWVAIKPAGGDQCQGCESSDLCCETTTTNHVAACPRAQPFCIHSRYYSNIRYRYSVLVHTGDRYLHLPLESTGYRPTVQWTGVSCECGPPCRI